MLATFSLVAALSGAQPYTSAYSLTDNSVTFKKVIPLPGKQVLAAGTLGTNVFFRKLDQNGGILWETLVDGDAVNDICVDPNGDVYGTSYNNNGTPVVETRLFDKVTGAVKWTNSVNSVVDAGSSIATAKVGNSVLLYSITTVPGAGPDVLCRRLNPKTGVQIWSNQMDGGVGGTDIGNDVTANAAGAPFFAMSLYTDVNTYKLSARRLDGTTGGIVWTYLGTGQFDFPTEIHHIFTTASGEVAVSGLRSGTNIDRAFHQGTGAFRYGIFLGTFVKPQPVRVRTVAPALDNGYFFSYAKGEQVGPFEIETGEVSYITNGLYRTIYNSGDWQDYAVAVLGVSSGGKVIVLRSDIQGGTTGVKRIDEMWREPLIGLTPGYTDFDFAGDFRQGFVDGNDFLVFNDHKVQRYNETLTVADDVFSLPLVNGQVSRPAHAVLYNDYGHGGGMLSVVTPPANGTVELNQDGGFTYTRGTGFTGTDSFVYRIDRDGQNDTATVTINDLKITGITFDPLIFGGERAAGQVTFNHTPFRGEIRAYETSPVMSAQVEGGSYQIPATNTFPLHIASDPVTVATNAAVTVRMHGLAKTGAFTIRPGTLASLTLSKNPVVGGEVLTGTVTLNAPATVSRVVLLAGDSDVTIPATVEVPVGATSADFVIKTDFVSRDETSQIRAQTGDNNRSVTLSIKARPRVTSFTGPATMGSGTSANFTVGLDKVTPYAYKVYLSAGSGISVPAFVTVSPGNSGKTFSLTAGTVGSPTVVTLTATTGGTSVTKQVTVNP